MLPLTASRSLPSKCMAVEGEPYPSPVGIVPVTPHHPWWERTMVQNGAEENSCCDALSM